MTAEQAIELWAKAKGYVPQDATNVSMLEHSEDSSYSEFTQEAYICRDIWYTYLGTRVNKPLGEFPLDQLLAEIFEVIG